jgi:biopolymer transport protein ExbB
MIFVLNSNSTVLNNIKEAIIMIMNLVNGGWMMVPLFICSIVSLGIIIERARYFRNACSMIDTESIFSLVEKNDINRARQTAHESDHPLYKIFLEGLMHSKEPDKAMESAAITHIASLKQRLPALDTIITLSPLLGLLGTIIGMIDSFNIMSISGNSQPHAVTGGVAEALICTATGICVAVFTLIPYNYFLARIERETEKVEEYATHLELLLRVERKAQIIDPELSDIDIRNREFTVAEEVVR